MSAARGYLTKAALTREALTSTPTWPAGAPAAALSLLPLLGEGVQARPVRQAFATRAPQTGTSAPRTLGTVVRGPLHLLGVYEGLELVWAMALGLQARRYGGVLFPQQLAVGAYRHRCEVDAALHSHPWRSGAGFVCGTDTLVSGTQLARRATLVVDKQVSAWEALSVMLERLTLAATAEAVTLTADVVGHRLDRASATNPNLDALSDPGWQELRFDQLELRLAAQSTVTPLGSGNALTVSGLTVTLDNRLSAPFTRLSGTAIDEPRRTGVPSVTGTLDVPRYSSETLLNWAANGTTLMVSATFTGPQIGATGQTYSLTLWLPELVLDDAEAPTAGPGLTRLRLPFTASVPSLSPAGFPEVLTAGPLVVEVVSAQSAHVLL